jgi:hypothetical protein
MKRARFWVVLGIGVSVLAAVTFATRSGSGRAYLDLATGNPKFFLVAGPPLDHPVELPPDVRELERRGVEVVGVGCVPHSEQDAYNTVITRHVKLQDVPLDMPL